MTPEERAVIDAAKAWEDAHAGGPVFPRKMALHDAVRRLREAERKPVVLGPIIALEGNQCQ